MVMATSPQAINEEQKKCFEWELIERENKST